MKKITLVFLMLLLGVLFAGCMCDNLKQKEVNLIDAMPRQLSKLSVLKGNESYFMLTDGLLPFYPQHDFWMYRVYTNNIESANVRIYKLSESGYKSLKGQEGGMARQEGLLDLSKLVDEEKSRIFQGEVKVNEDYKLPAPSELYAANGYMELPINEEGLYYIEFTDEFGGGGQHALIQLVRVITAY